MADDKSKQGRNRGHVAGGKEYEVRYFAEKHWTSIEQAQGLIDGVGNSREALDAAAATLKSQ